MSHEQQQRNEFITISEICKREKNKIIKGKQYDIMIVDEEILYVFSLLPIHLRILSRKHLS